MKTFTSLAVCAAVLGGCAFPTISTELDPEGSPKYRTAGTGSNFIRREDPQAAIKAGQKTLDRDDLDRMLRAGGAAPKGSGT